METENTSRRGVKRRRTSSSPDQNQLKKINQRKKVNFSGDTWLETFKFLTCPQWSQMCFVCRKINGIAQRNILRLPRMWLNSAAMYYADYCARPKEWKKLSMTRYTIVAFDNVMQGKQSTEWFKNRGFTLDAPEGMQAENALIGGRKWKGYGRGNEWKGNVNVCILGSAKETIPLSNTERCFPWFYNLAFQTDQFIKPVAYYAQFNPILNPYSWDYLAQFFKYIYHPSSYIKEVSLFAIHQNFIDYLKCTADNFYIEPRHIRCESFVLEGKIGTNIADVSDSLKWLARNVRAETVYIPDVSCSDAFDLLANFLLEESGAKQCASTKIEILVSDPVAFLNILMEKFRLIPLVESAMPTISFFYPSQEEHRAHLGPNLISQEVGSQSTYAVYLISNGQNRMRISFHYSKWCFVSNVDVYSI